MITDAILRVLFFIPQLILDALPNLEINLTFNETIFESFKDMVSCLNYVLPLQVLFLCLGVKMAVRVWALPYAIALRIKSFIPTMGH